MSHDNCFTTMTPPHRHRTDEAPIRLEKISNGWLVIYKKVVGEPPTDKPLPEKEPDRMKEQVRRQVAADLCAIVTERTFCVENAIAAVIVDAIAAYSEVEALEKRRGPWASTAGGTYLADLKELPALGERF